MRCGADRYYGSALPTLTTAGKRRRRGAGLKGTLILGILEFNKAVLNDGLVILPGAPAGRSEGATKGLHMNSTMENNNTLSGKDLAAQ
jgi:hypothetical protein